jgi:hypothetical protein
LAFGCGLFRGLMDQQCCWRVVGQASPTASQKLRAPSAIAQFRPHIEPAGPAFHDQGSDADRRLHELNTGEFRLLTALPRLLPLGHD